MPRTPAWIKKSNEIKARAEACPAFAFDRAAVAELFAVGQRQAATLLDAMGAERIGGAFIVPRDRLLAFLDGRAAEDPGVVQEQQRRQTLARKLADLRSAGPPLRAVRVAAPPHPSSLPPCVTVSGPGELKLTFDPHSPGTLLGAILALAEFSEAHPAAFAESLEYIPPNGEPEEE